MSQDNFLNALVPLQRLSRLSFSLQDSYMSKTAGYDVETLARRITDVLPSHQKGRILVIALLEWDVVTDEHGIKTIRFAGSS